MTNSFRLLDQIAGITSLRDLELLEFSLLKTMNGLIKPVSIDLFKVDSKLNPVKEIRYTGGTCNVSYDDIDLRREVLGAAEYLGKADADEHRLRLEGMVINLFLVQQTRRTRTYLNIVSNQGISKVNSFVIKGMLNIYRNFSELLVDSQTDELTGLANRKTFDESISKVYEMIVPEEPEFPNDQRSHDGEARHSYWLSLLDVDHFKRVNDTFGHLYGDEGLVLLSNLMRATFREDDLLYRFGGEEFVVILKCPDQGACSAALERFRKLVETTEFPGVGHITISIGAVRIDPDIFHVNLLDYADQALYASKDNGRNQVNFLNNWWRSARLTRRRSTSGRSTCSSQSRKFSAGPSAGRL